MRIANSISIVLILLIQCYHLNAQEFSISDMVNRIACIEVKEEFDAVYVFQNTIEHINLNDSSNSCAYIFINRSIYRALSEHDTVLTMSLKYDDSQSTSTELVYSCELAFAYKGFYSSENPVLINYGLVYFVFRKQDSIWEVSIEDPNRIFRW